MHDLSEFLEKTVPEELWASIKPGRLQDNLSMKDNPGLP